jgi:triacylglycerol lipase
MGPLDSRYLIANLSIPGKGPAKNFVASLTSISGVNGGSEIADIIYWWSTNSIPVLDSAITSLISGGVNAFASLFFFNTSDPDCLKALYNLTTNYVKNVFNPNTPNQAGVMYQSWGGKINYVGVTPEYVMVGPLWLLMNAMGSDDNDALVSIKSAKLGTWRGALTTSLLYPGVTHTNETNQLFGITPGFDAPGFYVKTVKELKSKGY